MAVREQALGQPDANTIRASAATFTRELEHTPIRQFVSFQMDSTLFNATTNWGAALDYQTAEGALLKADTAYTLYAVSETDTSDTTVYHVLDFTTDAVPDADNLDTYNIVPSTDSTRFAIRKGQPFVQWMFFKTTDDITIADSNYTGDETTASPDTGTVSPAVSSKDNSLYFAVKKYGSGLAVMMLSKEHYKNTSIEGDHRNTINPDKFNKTFTVGSTTYTTYYVAN